MIAAGVSDVEGEAGRCSKSFDLGRPGLLRGRPMFANHQSPAERQHHGCRKPRRANRLSISDSRRWSGQQSAESFTE